MQTLTEIRRLLDEAGIRPRRQLAQCFLIDQNLLEKVVALADPASDATVLEVGPGTGTLSEELLDRVSRVVAVEIDLGLAELLARRLGDRDNLVLLRADALAGKHELNPDVLAALGDRADLVSNLPYNIATPIVAQSLLSSFHAHKTAAGTRFDRMTFLVQQEVADRFAARPGSKDYGPVSVLVSLLGEIRVGAKAPASAFWPRPKVASRMVRIDFDPDRAAQVVDAERLRRTLSLFFGQRRKQVASIARRASGRGGPHWLALLEQVGIDPASRAERIAPPQWRDLANAADARAG